MKASFFLCAMVVVCTTASAETPIPVYPKTKHIHPVEWYAHQADLWKASVHKQADDASSWINYYIASRYAQATESRLNEIASAASAAIAGTCEFHLIEAWERGYSEEGFQSVQEAYRINPDYTLSFPSMLLFGEYKLNREIRKQFGDKLMTSDLVSSSLLNYSYNVLMSLEQNAILFTDSENTTIPLFILQDVIGIRKDVTVLFLDLLLEESYLAPKLAEHSLSSSSLVSGSKAELCAMLPSQNPSRAFYYALTLSKENILPIKDQLYVVGLASQLSTTRIDNIAQIKSNLENRFLLDYLTVDFNGENEFAAGKVLSANYLVPMLLLLEHYRSIKDETKASELSLQIRSLAEKSGKGTLVTNFLNSKVSNEVAFIPYKLDTKAIEGQFKHVKDNIYAHEYEVTNKQYNAFLQYLTDNKRSDLLEVAKIHFEQYEEPALSFMKGYHANRQPTKKEKYFLNYPVINISFKGAEAYCQWLTEQYNNDPERKYKKVKFRLPSRNEWLIASFGVRNAKSWNLDENSVEVKIFEEGKESGRKYETRSVSLSDPEIQYPWFRHWWARDRVLNTHGCSLGNFKWPDDQKACQERIVAVDGFQLMSPVQAYFPNEIGLYDVVGNVAEMINEEGKACGGSWNHPPEESTMRSINLYNGPSSEIGFRVFMEVIEQ